MERSRQEYLKFESKSVLWETDSFKEVKSCTLFDYIKTPYFRAREMTQYLRPFDVLAEDLGLLPKTYTKVITTCNFSFKKHTPSSGLPIRHMYSAYT